MVELKLFLMPTLKRSGRVKAFLENTTRRVDIFQKSRLGLDSSLEGRFHIFASKTVEFDRFDNHIYGYIQQKKVILWITDKKRLIYSIKKAWISLIYPGVLRKPCSYDKFYPR